MKSLLVVVVAGVATTMSDAVVVGARTGVMIAIAGAEAGSKLEVDDK